MTSPGRQTLYNSSPRELNSDEKDHISAFASWRLNQTHNRKVEPRALSTVPLRNLCLLSSIEQLSSEPRQTVELERIRVQNVLSDKVLDCTDQEKQCQIKNSLSHRSLPISSDSIDTTFCSYFESGAPSSFSRKGVDMDTSGPFPLCKSGAQSSFSRKGVDMDTRGPFPLCIEMGELSYTPSFQRQRFQESIFDLFECPTKTGADTTSSHVSINANIALNDWKNIVTDDYGDDNKEGSGKEQQIVPCLQQQQQHQQQEQSSMTSISLEFPASAKQTSVSSCSDVTQSRKPKNSFMSDTTSDDYDDYDCHDISNSTDNDEESTDGFQFDLYLATDNQSIASDITFITRLDDEDDEWE